MEDTLRAARSGNQTYSVIVLILVLMEDTLRVTFFEGISRTECLNPCFNGRYSQSILLNLQKETSGLCLNPCFNGRYSQSLQYQH